MEYLQSFLIVVMEMVCFFLFQDAFVPCVGFKLALLLIVFTLSPSRSFIIALRNTQVRQTR